jgi:hypothetical protein
MEMISESMVYVFQREILEKGKVVQKRIAEKKVGAFLQ